MVTVLCVFVRGEYPYTAEYVRRLGVMVRRWIDRPFRFVCLTDQPFMGRIFSEPGITSVETIEITPLSANGGCWSKLEIFNPARQWSGRMLYLDLDSLLVASLAPILDFPAPFAITVDELLTENRKTVDRFGRAIVRRFNSSVMVWDAGEAERLYTDWRPAVSGRLSGDQDWIGEQMPDAAGMPAAWFPRISRVQPPWPREAKVVLVKNPKNHVAAERWPWFASQWGAA